MPGGGSKPAQRRGGRKTDDFPDLICDEVLRRVARRPGDSSTLLMPIREMHGMFARMHWIIDELNRSIGVNGDVIPGWHYFAGLSLGRIPGWCDIGIRGLSISIARRCIVLACAIVSRVLRPASSRARSHVSYASTLLVPRRPRDANRWEATMRR